MTREEIQKALQILHRAYPSYPIPDKKQMVELWTYYFINCQPETIYKAVQIHIKCHKFFPTINEMVTLVNKLQGASSLPMIEAPERVIDWKESGCQLCPYLKEIQTEPCKVCVW